MHFSSRLLAAAGVRAHPARQDLREPAHDHDQTAGARRPAGRRRARAAVAVTAIAVPLLAGTTPALATTGPVVSAPAPARAGAGLPGRVLLLRRRRLRR